jgi:hypothetical protein
LDRSCVEGEGVRRRSWLRCPSPGCVRGCPVRRRPSTHGAASRVPGMGYLQRVTYNRASPIPPMRKQ